MIPARGANGAGTNFMPAETSGARVMRRIVAQRFALARWIVAPVVVLALAAGCAKQGRPPGGPEDTTPPTLVSSTPEAMAVHVPAGIDVKLEFSESMNEDSVEKNLFIVPLPETWPGLSWESRGKRLVIDFSPALEEGTTYVVTIGAKATDLRNNPLTESIVLPFSTGDTVENDVIRGEVIPYDFLSDEPPDVAGVDVAAYRIDGGESPDPRDDIPDYVTQTGDDGEYEIMGLTSGVYRLFAIGDRDRNGFYTPGYDRIGIAPADVTLAPGDTLALAPAIPIAAPDTSMVQVMSVRVSGSRGVQVFFNREIQAGSMSATIPGLDIMEYLASAENPNRVLLLTSPQQDGRRYEFSSIEARGRWGNPVAPLVVQPYFTGTDTPDTTSLGIVSMEPPLLKPGNDPVSLRFNMMLDLPDDPQTVVSEAAPADVRVTVTGPGSLRLSPADNWLAGENYTIRFDPELLLGYDGNRLAESDSVVAFRVVPADTLGYITGTIEENAPGAAGAYRLYLRNIDAGVTETVMADAPGEWETGPVLPGRYLVSGYRDGNGNGVFDRGSIDPFAYSEHAAASRDTLQVLSRWTNSENVIIFR